MFVNNFFGIINNHTMQVNDVNEHQEKNEQGKIVHRIYLLQTKKKRELEIGKSKVLNHHLAAFRFDFIE